MKDLITVRNEVAKVMFLHLSVSHSVHRGGCTCSQEGTCPPPIGSRYPPGRHTPQVGTPPSRCTPLAGTPPGQVHPSRQVHPPGRYTPWAGTPPGQVHAPASTPPSRYPYSPRQTATVADGTHPTGMHSCIKVFNCFVFLSLSTVTV